jgi:hypothetical protein
MMEPALAAVETVAAGARESAMIGACQLRDVRAGCGMRIAFRGFDRAQPSPASSAILSFAKTSSDGLARARAEVTGLRRRAAVRSDVERGASARLAEAGGGVRSARSA